LTSINARGSQRPSVSAVEEAREDVDVVRSRLKPCAPIFGVEVIDAEGYVCLYRCLYLHEAIEISGYFEGEARLGKEPRVFIPSALVSMGLTDD
jgi:hypothetical protein